MLPGVPIRLYIQCNCHALVYSSCIDIQCIHCTHGGSLATVAIPGVNPRVLNVPTYGHDEKHRGLYIPTFEWIVSATLEAWWQRVPLSAGRIELRPASLSFIHVESEFLPFNDYNLTFLYVNRVFCTIRFPDGGGLVL